MSTLNHDLHDARRFNETAHQAPTRSYEPGEHCFGVCLFGFTIYVEAPSLGVMELLERCVFPSVPRTEVDSSRADLCLRVVQDADEFRLYRDDCFVASAPRADQLLRELIDCLDSGFVEGVRNLSAVHAGAVLVGDRALVFPGASHAGKSALVAELLRQGAICFSDEYALIDSEGLVHAYPRPLLLRNGGSEQTAVLPVELNARVASSPAKVGWIFSLQYKSGGSWNIKEVSQGQGLLSLLQNTPHILASSPHIVGSFHRAAGRARCFEGQRGDWSDAVSRIMRLTLDS